MTWHEEEQRYMCSLFSLNGSGLGKVTRLLLCSSTTLVYLLDNAVFSCSWKRPWDPYFKKFTDPYITKFWETKQTHLNSKQNQTALIWRRCHRLPNTTLICSIPLNMVYNTFEANLHASGYLPVDLYHFVANAWLTKVKNALQVTTKSYSMPPITLKTHHQVLEAASCHKSSCRQCPRTQVASPRNIRCIWNNVKKSRDEKSERLVGKN